MVPVPAGGSGVGSGVCVVPVTDVIALLASRRKAAGEDLARRIAHDSKIPLTPSQLAAERLRRRYLPQISNDPETFQQCTDKIVRQVDDLRRMVDEFSSFARLPPPVMQPEDLADLCSTAVFLQGPAHTRIVYVVEPADNPVRVSCHRRPKHQ